jgi:hypothetical protein
MSSNLTPAQLATFKAAILADSSQTQNVSAKAHGAIAAYYAAAGTGNVWRPSISTSELNTAIVWSEFAALTALLQNTYLALIAPGYVDATSANVRAAFATIFGAATTSRPNLTAIAQRPASRFEALFTTSQVCSLFGATPSVEDVVAALGS